MNTAEKYLSFRKGIPETVLILAVSKTKSAEEIMQLYNAGHRDFGENYVQELLSKYELLPKDIRWHFIGHLQSNKVKYLVPFVHLIHSVDSIKLINEINKEAAKINRNVSVLIQAYVGNESTKFGLNTNEINELLGQFSMTKKGWVTIRGLMGMASNTDNEEIIRNEFTEMKRVFDAHKKNESLGIKFEILSMGMSSDYTFALECGSNLIRVGSLIFGERNYNKQI